MRKACLMLVVWGGIGSWASLVRAQTIRLRGELVDFRSHQPLTGSWQWTNATGQRLPVSVASTRAFAGLVPVSARYLTVSSRGYRSLRLPVHWPYTPGDSLCFQVALPLVPIDSSTRTQPYFQSEQRPLRLRASPAGGTRRQVRVVVLDAVTRKSVRAGLCFYATREAGPRCYTVSSLQTGFIPPDVVAFEARAPAYQPYFGNIIISDSSGQVPLTIRLNPMPALMMLSMQNGILPDQLQLSALATRLVYPLTSADSVHFWGVAPPGRYQLTTVTGQSVAPNDTIHVLEGLNTWVRPLATPQKKSSERSAVATIYFAQSSYTLSDSARQQLSELASLLRRQPYQTLRIVGHTDNVGNPQLNQALSEYRARTVLLYLRRCGLHEQRLQLEATGSARPAASNDTEESRRLNRRVSLYLP